MDEAQGIAAEAGVYLEGLTGYRMGIVGALAAVGLRRAEARTRFLVRTRRASSAVGEQRAAVFAAARVERFVAGDDDVASLSPAT